MDEIQNVEDWALVIRRIFDTKDVDLYLSGSSAKLLSKDLHTSLRGRSTALEIWPFNLIEYTRASKYSIPQGPFNQRTYDKMFNYLNMFLNQGGFPELIQTEHHIQTLILQEYVELVIIKDIVERYRLENIVLLKYLLHNILKNISSNFSASKFSNDIKSHGVQGSKGSILEYLQYLEDAYLIFPVNLYSESIKKVQSNPRKMYAVDSGLANAYVFSKHHNYGHLFENIVYLWLRRARHKIYYYITKKDRYEVDFFTKDLNGNLHLYQVCWNIDDNTTLDRELRALKIAEQELDVQGTLVTPKNFLRDFVLQKNF